MRQVVRAPRADDAARGQSSASPGAGTPGIPLFVRNELVPWLRRAARVVRTIVGAPDYERYVAHMREHHQACDVVSRDEFMRQRLENRYSRPGSRCC